MTAPKWGDRVGTPRICALCGRSGFDVKPGLACWPGDVCQSMDRCSDRRDECRARAEENGIAWPTGIDRDPPSLALPGFGGDA